MESEQPQEFDRERKSKQDYLKRHILEGNFDPEHFSSFLLQERFEGDQIDNWTYEELETMVAIYKREIRTKQPDLDLYYKMEDIELNDEHTAVFARVIRTPLRQGTLLSNSPQTMQITKVNIVEGGLFYGKSLAFELLMYPSRLVVVRSEDQFRWLAETVSLEFPQTPIPPLIKHPGKVFDSQSLVLVKQYYERFLNEMARHNDLRYSLAYDNFLKCKSKEELDLKKAEIENFLKRSVLIERNLSKKKYDSFNQNVLALYPTPTGNMALKISQILKSHFVNTDLKLNAYEFSFEKLEKIALEFDKLFKKLIKTNEKYKETVLEMQTAALKYNSAKIVKQTACLTEDIVFGSISTFLAQNGGLKRTTAF